MSSTILVTGGTGTIGNVLTRMLIDQGYRVIVLSRNAPPNGLPPREPNPAEAPTLQRLRWDPEKNYLDPEAIRQADHIIHLAGAGVADKRWSAKRKKIIEESRTKSCALLATALRDIPNRVQTVVSSSAIGWYGPDPTIPNPHPFDESAPPADDFLGETCKRWEAAIAPVTTLNKRLVIIRTGIVLASEGGALKEFRKPVGFGIAPILGSGRQMISWIHVDDICRLYLHAIESRSWSGVFNGVAPQPVTNRTLMLDLARRIKGRYFVPVYVPSFILKIMLGEMSIEVLKSVTVSDKKARAEGFQFLHPSLDSALNALLKTRDRFS